MKQGIRIGIYRTIGVFVLLLATVGCREKIFESPVSGRNISFSTRLSTRAAAFTEEGSTAYKSMGMYAASASHDWTTGGNSTLIMNNSEIVRENGVDGWSYTPSVPWPTGEKVSFFAYAPYFVLGLSFSGVSGTTLNSVPTMEYIVPNLTADQTDLLVANARYNLTDTTGSVRIAMNHALTRILFSARTAHSVHPDSVVKITRIKLTGIKNTGERSMDFGPTVSWAVLATTADYTLANDDIQLKDSLLTQSLKPLTLDGGNLYLMPQRFTNGGAAKLSVTYQTFYKDLSTATAPVILEKNMTDVLDEWQQGEAIRYILTVPNNAKPEAFEIAYQHIPWETENTDVTINADPYLDISNVNRNCYDAAATRIYFFCNQPPDKVYVDSIGKVSTGEGPDFPVKREFYALAQGDSDGTSCFHYDYNPALGTGMGYIDVINRNTVTAGNSSNNGKYPLVIKLRAGRISRDITLQPVVTEEAAKQNLTPYIGTFHRWNETGERIVTWHLPSHVAWRATIQANGDPDKLVIDRLASPDYAHNALYSFAPRDPEGSKVDPTISGTGGFVQGKGRIYFRVGWKGYAPSPYVITGDTNRYAKIEVRYPHLSGAPGDTVVQLFCRQGEMPHHIAAVPSLFAVYNTGLFRQFTQHPTQAGMIYQWNRTYGWDPLGLPKPSAYPGDFETDFSYERSACPDGYVYPSTLQMLEMRDALDLDLKQWGYYADGFFDRRRITTGDHRVETTSLDVAAAGVMFYNPVNARAIFLPTAGYRKPNTTPIDSIGQLTEPGTQCGYWTDSTDTSVGNNSLAAGMILHRDADVSNLTSYSKTSGFSLRCIKAPAWLVLFDANGGENAPRTLTIPLPVGSNEVTLNLPLTVPDNYWKVGWHFVGWNTAKDGSGQNYAAGASITLFANITLYAQWIQ